MVFKCGFQPLLIRCFEALKGFRNNLDIAAKFCILYGFCQHNSAVYLKCIPAMPTDSKNPD